MKKYTFGSFVSTPEYLQSGKIVGYGDTEIEAREDAIKKICQVHRVSSDCVRIEKLVSVE